MILFVRSQNSRKESFESNIPNPTIFTPLHLRPSSGMFKRVSLMATSGGTSTGGDDFIGGGNSTGIPFIKKFQINLQHKFIKKE